jgi:DNA-binding NarL/FixJ family response regulator
LIRVLVADNSHIHTQALESALKCDSELQVTAFSADTSGLALAAKEIDVLVISSVLDDESDGGLIAARRLHEALPQVRTVILLDSAKEEKVVQSFRSGARGLIGRHESVDTLCKCIHSVYQGQIWASSLQMSLAVEALASEPNVRALDAHGIALLSKRELEVIRCVAEGLTNQEIAQRLGLSQHTIKNHLFCIFDKLGVSSRIELLLMTLSNTVGPSSLFGERATEARENERTGRANGKNLSRREVRKLVDLPVLSTDAFSSPLEKL